MPSQTFKPWKKKKKRSIVEAPRNRSSNRVLAPAALLLDGHGRKRNHTVLAKDDHGRWLGDLPEGRDQWAGLAPERQHEVRVVVRDDVAADQRVWFARSMVQVGGKDPT